MKKFLLLLIIITNQWGHAQDFDMALRSITKTTAIKLNAQNKTLNVVVYPFYNRKNKHTDLSRLISDDFSVYLSEFKNRYKIFDRSYLEQMMQEHRLNEEGLIDPSTAKKFGMLIAADVYITGKVMLFGTSIRLHVFAIDTQTGERVFSGFKRIPLDEDMASFLGIKDYKKRKDKEEMYKSTNPNCAAEKVGDYCFVNKTSNRLTVYLQNLKDSQFYGGYIRNLSLNPNEKKCFKNLPEGGYKYIARKSQVYIGDIIPQGEFYVKTCLSNYIIIR